MKKAEFKKYRRKPIEVEAIQWVVRHTPSDDAKPIVDLINSLGGEAHFVYTHDDNVRFHPKISVKTLDSVAYVSPNDYICRGIDGEFWPVKPHIFEKTNEPISEIEDFVTGRSEVGTEVITLKEFD